MKLAILRRRMPPTRLRRGGITFMGKFITSVILTTRYLFLLLVNREKVIVGAWSHIKYGDEPEHYISYISFSKEPDYTADLDDYGFRDDEVYAYITKKEFLQRLWVGHEYLNWRITDFRLNISELLE